MNTIRCWIVIRNATELRLVKTRPYLAANEVAVEVTINAPSPPRIIGSVSIDLPEPPPASAEAVAVQYEDEDEDEDEDE